MAGQREVILVGLGKFGDFVSNNLVNMIEERSVQLGKIANSVILHTVNFQDDAVFHATDYMNIILETVKDSSAYKNGEKFDFIFTGDLYERVSSQYAVDFAYLPYLLQQTATFKMGEVIGFFTFAAELGVTEKTPDEVLSLICRHFSRLEAINRKDTYTVPFKTVMDKPFKNVDSSAGPFIRNYVLVTPGKSNVVSRETGIVFAERIFYELFYISEKMDELSHNWIAAVSDRSNSDKNLSCFSMVQIPRVNEVQRYYLKYLFEEQIISSFLQDPIKGTDGEYYLAKFFEMIDVPYKNDDFPIERASELFIDRYRENFTHLLNSYISGSYSDFKEYIAECKQRIEHTVFDMLPRYDDFAQREIDNFSGTIKTGFENLFKVDRINGNFKTYISFVEALKKKLEHWEISLKAISEGTEVYGLEEDFKKADATIDRIQKKKIFSFFPLRNIRKKLIENTILSLPVEKYLDSLIRQNLAKAFLQYWQHLCENKKSPLDFCQVILDNLHNLELRFESKEKYLLNKIKFIENMNGSYYILPMFESSDDYDKLLQRIKSRNFGQHNSQRINDAVSSALKLYVAEKDIFSITQNPTEFINFIENKYIIENKNLFSEIEEKIEEFYDFSKQAVEATKRKTENINCISFETSGTSLFQNEIILNPADVDADSLSEEIDSQFGSSLKRMEIPKDFTLGSVVYFKDYLYMSQEDMKKKDFLENYRNIGAPEPQYDNALTEEEITAADEQNQDAAEESGSELWKYTRSVILFYMQNEELVALYNKTFNDSKEFISEQESDDLAMKIPLEEALRELSDEKLFEFAKDYDVRLCEDREKQERLIVHELSGR